jgi:hypothetical protein
LAADQRQGEADQDRREGRQPRPLVDRIRRLEPAENSASD